MKATFHTQPSHRRPGLICSAYEVYSDSEKYAKEFSELEPYKNHGHEHPRDPAVMYRRIFGISRKVTIEFMGVWVSLHFVQEMVEGARERGVQYTCHVSEAS